LPKGTGIAGVLTKEQDADDTRNFAADDVAGFNVNAIAIEVPIELLTYDGKRHAASDPLATIGALGHHLPAANQGLSPAGRAGGGVGSGGANPAHGQSAVQRVDHRHRRQGQIQHEPAPRTTPSSPTTHWTRSWRGC
jgi:hypothetical protein